MYKFVIIKNVQYQIHPIQSLLGFHVYNLLLEWTLQALEVEQNTVELSLLNVARGIKVAHLAKGCESLLP